MESLTKHINRKEEELRESMANEKLSVNLVKEAQEELQTFKEKIDMLLGDADAVRREVSNEM